MGDFTSDPIDDLRKEKNRRIAELEAQLRAANERADAGWTGLANIFKILIEARKCEEMRGRVENEKETGRVHETTAVTPSTLGRRANSSYNMLPGGVMETEYYVCDTCGSRVPPGGVDAEGLLRTSGYFTSILGPELFVRRAEQDAEHGGPSHDDAHTEDDWIGFITKFKNRADRCRLRDGLGYENALFDVAALAIAAIQSSRRKRDAR